MILLLQNSCKFVIYIPSVLFDSGQLSILGGSAELLSEPKIGSANLREKVPMNGSAERREHFSMWESEDTVLRRIGDA